MDKRTIRTTILLTVPTFAVVIAAIALLPDYIPLHFGPTGAGTVASKFLLLLFVPIPAIIYVAARRKSARKRNEEQ